MIEASLERALIELVRAANKHSIRLILCGGFGVLLRVRRAQLGQDPTLAEPPVARATRDLDFLLPQQIVVDPQQMERLRGVLDLLQYREVERARYYQFIGAPDTAAVRVDLHAVPPPEGAPVKIDSRRIRPHGYRLLHARRLDEALGSEQHPVSIMMTLDGVVTTDPREYSVEVLTPNLFSYLAMKLVACRDNLQKREEDEARRHAYDMFALWASASERIWTEALTVSEATLGAPLRAEMREAVTRLFADRDSMGSIRLREALRNEDTVVAEEDLERFCSDLSKLFFF